jgi:hypothetical protein
MSTYYLNAELNPLIGPAGYPNLLSLIQAIQLNSGDIIKLVDNGIIDDSASGIINVTVPITIMSYEGNNSKPSWNLPENGGNLSLVIQSIPNGYFLYDIIFLSNTGSSIVIPNYYLSNVQTSEVSRCEFNLVNLYIRGQSGNINATISNNLFITSDVIFTVIYEYGGAFDGGGMTVTINACNNDFYNTDDSLSLYLNSWNTIYDIRILNNIFYSLSDYCIRLIADTSDIPYNTYDILIDYNDTFNFTSEFNSGCLPYLGSHNLSSQDPLFTSPSDFTPQSGSPCIATGIGYNSQSSVPTIDFNSASISLTIPDIGAIKYAGSPPPPPVAIDYWISPVSSNWNNSSNWFSASVPGTDTTVIFDSHGDGACSIDVSVTISNLLVANAYDSTITQNGNSISVSKSTSFDGGVFIGDPSSIQTGTIYLGYGIVQDSTINISQDMSCASTHNQWSSLNNSNLIINGTGQQNIYVEAGGIVPTLTINKTDSTHVMVYGGDPITIKDDFLIYDGTFNTNGLSIQVGI